MNLWLVRGAYALGQQAVFGLLALGSGGLVYLFRAAGDPGPGWVATTFCGLCVLGFGRALLTARRWLRSLRDGPS